jgi:hypothetical protein
MKLNQFPLIEELNEDDYLLVWQSSTGITGKVRIGDLPSSGSGSTPGSVDLIFNTSGDSKGLFYYLGTEGLIVAWGNPHTKGIITVSLSSAFDGANNNPPALINRTADNGSASQNVANSWFKFDLKARTLIPTYYSIRGRTFNASHLRNWKFQASNDDSAWTDLDTKVSNTTITADGWGSFPVTGITTAYRYFRILQTGLNSFGDNVLTMGEFEIYGTLPGGF